MRLLVSVRDVSEVGAALAGGADIVDVKDPSRGPLGAASLETVRAVRASAAPPHLVSAALGEASDAGVEIVAKAAAAAAAGADFVKLAVLGEARRAGAWLRAIVEAVGEAEPAARLVAVAYADRRKGDPLFAMIDAAAAAGAHAVMLDTASKDGRSLLDHLQERALARWIERAHAAGLWAGCAGNLGKDEIERLCALGPDVVGVRGAACVGGRAGTVNAARVAELRHVIHRGTQLASNPARQGRRRAELVSGAEDAGARPDGWPRAVKRSGVPRALRER